MKTSGGQRAGLVLRVATFDGEARSASLCGGPLVFLSANEARAVVEVGACSIVDYALDVGVGVATIGGQLVTLLDLDAPIDPASEVRGRLGILSEIESGESVLVVGGPILATGSFEPATVVDGVVFEGEEIALLSIALVYRKVEARVWESRALAAQGRPPPSRRSEGRTP